MTPEQVQRANEYVRIELEAPTSVEALSWLKTGVEDPDRGNETMRSFSSSSEDILADEEAIELVKMLYDFGAEVVTAIDVDGLENNEFYQDTDSLIITLTLTQPAKDKLFSFIGQWDKGRGWDEERDFGQKYLLMRWS